MCLRIDPKGLCSSTLDQNLQRIRSNMPQDMKFEEFQSAHRLFKMMNQFWFAYDAKDNYP